MLRILFGAKAPHKVLQVGRYYSKSRECRWETKKVFFMTIRKKVWCVQRLVVWKTDKKTETDSSINFGLLGATFLFFRFPYVFVRCCIMQYCGKLCTFLAQIQLKRRRSGVIKRYVLEQWIKRRGILKLNQSFLYLDL